MKKFAVVQDSCDGDVCSSGFQVIEPSEQYNLEYLKTVLMSEIVIKQFEALMTGALYPAINQSQLSSFLVPFPNPEIQETIANKVLAIKGQIKAHRQKAASLRALAKEQFEEDVFGE